MKSKNGFGDLWEEFNRIVWCAQAAPLFATGMADDILDWYDGMKNTVPKWYMK